MALEDFTDDALQQELENRKKRKIAPPTIKANPDFTRLIQTMESGVADMIERGYEDDSTEAYIAEAAWEALYGKEFWAWQKASKIERL